jgi:uncharacterized protein YpmS
MKKVDRSRLRREYEYLRGSMEMISWVTLTNPTDEQIETRLDKLQARLETIVRMLKIIDGQIISKNTE